MRLVQEQLDLYGNWAAAGDGLSRQVWTTPGHNVADKEGRL
jgi:hypothetical protein